MAAESMGVYAFQVGKLRCLVVSDQEQPVAPNWNPDDITGWFPDVEPDAVRDAAEAHAESMRHVNGPWFNTFLIETDTNRVMVDGGMGKTDRPGVGRTLSHLAHVGITPDSVDTVVLTHAHGDHYLGLTDDSGALTFPNARHITWKAEWDYWTREDKLDENPTLRDRLLPLQEALHFIETDRAEIVPGVQTVALPGHTPGHAGLLLESDGERLLDVVDVLHFLFQFQHPDWHPRVDTDPEQAARTRREILGYAAGENLLTLTYHLPFPSLGYVKRDGDAFAWHPV